MGLLCKKASGFPPFDNRKLWLLLPLVRIGFHDFFGAFFITTLSWRTERLKEYECSLLNKPGKFIIIGEALGSTLGMGGYMGAITLAAPAIF